MSLAWQVAEDDGFVVGIVLCFIVTIFGQGIWRGWGCGGGVGTGNEGCGINSVVCGKWGMTEPNLERTTGEGRIPRDGGGTLHSPHLSSYAVHKLQYVV